MKDMGEPILLQSEDYMPAVGYDEISREKVIRETFQQTLTNRQKSDKIISDSRSGAERLVSSAQKEAKAIIESAKKAKDRILHEANQGKEEIIKEAQTNAEERRKSVESELKKIKNSAYNEGFNAGRAEGLKQGIEELNDLRFLVETIIDRLNESKREFLSKISAILVEIVFQIAKKVIKSSISQDKDYVLENLQKALDKISSQKSVNIHINTDEYELVNEQKEYLESLFKNSVNISLFKDKYLERGDCVIETDFGYIDGRVESQLNNIRQGVEKEL